MKLVENKKLRLAYNVLDTYQAGIELEGFEVKSLRQKLGSLEGSKIIIRGGEAFLVGSYIPPYQPANTPKSYDERRTRKLLLTKKELAELAQEEGSNGLTIHPLSWYTKGPYVKCELALCRRVQAHDKRETIKKDIARREVRAR
jgi:SsrA-binding protein